MKVGFVGLGNVGGQLAASLLRNGVDLMVRDLNKDIAQPLLYQGAGWAESPKDMGEQCQVVITCLPSPAASAAVLEADDGILAGFAASGGEGKIWAEMSTTIEAEVKRIGEKVKAVGAEPVDCPVSGGCHRAGTGNISIFAGCTRPTFETMLPLLTKMGRRILHTGELGTASILKVVTNYLATANLVSCIEALVTCKMAGLDMNTSYEAIAASSGTSFVHETESQVILNGSRDISFTLDLVDKDLSIFTEFAERVGAQLELSPFLLDIVRDGRATYGDREWSPNLIKRFEDKLGIEVLGTGFPPQMVDDEPEEPGYEVIPRR